MHFRMPSIDQGVQAGAWAVFFFLVLWIGMLALGVSSATALILSLVSAGAIFLFVRLRRKTAPANASNAARREHERGGGRARVRGAPRDAQPPQDADRRDCRARSNAGAEAPKQRASSG